MAARNQVAIPIMVRRFQPVGADYISARNQVRRDRTPGGCCRWARAAASRPYGPACKFGVGATISRPLGCV